MGDDEGCMVARICRPVVGRPMAWASGVAFALVVACSGESPDALMTSVNDHLRKGDRAAAVIQLKSVLQQVPDSAEARFLLGKTLLETGDAAGAAVELHKARSLGYSDDLVVPLLARALVEDGKFKDVIDEFADVRLGDRRAEAELQVALARAYAGRKLTELAESALNAALNAQPDHAGAQVLSARLLAQSGNLNSAMQTIDMTLERHPDDDAAWTLKGSFVVAERGDPGVALDAYRKAIALNDRNLEAHNGALTILAWRNDPAELQAQLNVLAKALPEHPLTRYFRAYLAYLQRDADSARNTVQPLVAAMPEDVRVLLLAGKIELQAGSLLQAESYFAKSLQLSPGSVLVRRLLVQTYLRGGQSEKALAVAEPVLGVAGPDAQLLALAGQAYLLGGDAKRANELFTRAARANPNDLTTQAALAFTAATLGDAAGGLRQLDTLAAREQDPVADFALISANIQRKDYAAALKAIDGLESKQPGSPLPLYLRGRVQVSMDRPSEARRSFEQALVADSSYLPAAASLATLDLADGKSDAARQRFERILVKDPKNVRSLIGLAEVAARSGASKEEVVRLLTEAVNADPRQPDPRLLLVDYLLRQEDLRGAMAAAQNAVGAFPASPQLLNALGRVQLASGDANQAVATFTKVSAMQSQSPESLLELARAHLASGNRVAARSALEKALAIRPDLLPAQRQLIALELSADRPQQALAVARIVQKQRPSEAIGFLFEGEIETQRKDFVAAERALRAALTRDPDNSEIAAKLHYVLVVAGKKADADRLSAGWVKQHPKDPRFVSWLGDQALARSDYAQAAGLYRQALEIDPNDAAVTNNLAWVLAQQGQPSALEAARKANAIAPNRPAFMDTLAYVLAMNGQFDEAIELQKRLVAQQGDTPAYRLNLAKIYIKAGRKSDAETELNELAKLGDKFRGQPEVAELLKSLKDT
jgi:putative PEP-CTERM system TPR-repeat lipoprotein